jgi:hypothetical protein
MEAVYSSETQAPIYQTLRRYIPDDRNFNPNVYSLPPWRRTVIA